MCNLEGLPYPVNFGRNLFYIYLGTLVEQNISASLSPLLIGGKTLLIFQTLVKNKKVLTISPQQHLLVIQLVLVTSPSSIVQKKHNPTTCFLQ